MKKIKVDVRVTVADTVSDALVRLYKDASAKDGAIALTEKVLGNDMLTLK